MASYSEELKQSVIQKMMPPNNMPVSQLVRETGISNWTLYSWRKKALSQGVPVPGNGKNPDQWTPENQLAVIIETAALNQTELAEYCRKKGQGKSFIRTVKPITKNKAITCRIWSILFQ